MRVSRSSDSPETASLPDETPSEPAPAPALTSGFPLVDPAAYRVDGEYARGGLGRVLLAHDTRLGRAVALKEILSPSPASIARFEREARITARLQHPAIVPVYESGRWPSGEPFYAMRLVRGRSLAEVVARTRSLAERLALVPNLVAVADAVAYAHGQRVIHRDLKPGNVLVGAFGETVVIDWGLAKDLGQGDDEALAFSWSAADPAREATVDGAVLGTPGYMAPEQARGEALDERADVYALGALIDHAFIGEARSRDVPLDLATIVRKAMAPLREDRYPTARELAEDLRRFQTGQLVSARRYSRWTLLGRWLRRHRAVVGVVTAAVIALTVAGGVGFRRVVRERNRAESALARADARADALVLQHAQSALEHDPTAALAWLRLYPAAAADPAAAWNVAVEAEARGVARHVFADPEGTPIAVAFTPDGALLASSSSDRLRLWDLSRGTPRGALERRHIHQVAFLRDGRTALAGDSSGGVYTVVLPGADSREVFRQQDEVRGLLPSPDGRFAVVTGLHPALQVVALPGGEVRSLVGHEGSVLDAALSRDGASLVSAGADGTVRAWDLATLQSRVIWTHRGSAGRVVLSPDGRVVASGGDDGEVRLGPLAREGGEPARVLPGFSRPIRSLTFSPDGALVAAADADTGFGVWRVATGERRALEGRQGRVHDLAYSPDGRLLASTSVDETLRLWEPAGAEVAVLRGHRTLDGPLAFSPDGRSIATMGGDGSVRVWAVPPTGRTLRGHDQRLFHVVFSPDGRHVATDSDDRTVRLWNVDSGEGRVLGTSGDRVYGLAFSPDGRYLASAGIDGRIGLWDLTAGTARTLEGHRGSVREVIFSPTDLLLASVGDDGSVRLWDPAAGTARILAGPGGPLRSLDFSRDGRALATFGGDRAVRLWDVASGEARQLGAGLGAVSDGSYRATFSRDGTLVACCAGGALAVWSVATGTARRWALPPGDARCTRLAFSPDDRALALPVSHDLHLLDLGSGAWRSLRGHTEHIHHFHFSPDGRFVVTASIDRTARAWELATGAAQVVHRHEGLVFDAAFSPDGRSVATASADGTAWVGRFDPARGLRPDPASVRARIDALTTAAIVGGRALTPDSGLR